MMPNLLSDNGGACNIFQLMLPGVASMLEHLAFSLVYGNTSYYIMAHLVSPKFTRVKKCKYMNINLVGQDGGNMASDSCNPCSITVN